MKHLALTLTIASMTLIGTLNEVSAAGPKHTKISPYVNPNPYPAPVRLGFMGRIEWGGMRVMSVNWNTPAQRMGLEPGDMIMAINGQKIQTQQQYFQALQFAGPYVNLLVRDVRSGWPVTIGGYLYAGGNPVYGAPVQAYAKTGNQNINSKPKKFTTKAQALKLVPNKKP